MPVTIVVGGQYGSEGKGKVACSLSRIQNAVASVRVGGPNSGHTVYDSAGRRMVLRQLPTSAVLPNVKCMIPAGAFVDVPLLFREIAETGISPDRLVIDPNAVIVTDQSRKAERDWGLTDSIGSTGSGTGAAVIARIRRGGDDILARSCPELSGLVRGVVPILRRCLDDGQRVVIEGTQGFALSVLHSPHYPFTTSRDTTASGCLSETGLSPLDVDEVVVVLRAFPIRVAGNSGPLPYEISWEDITRESGSSEKIVERTSVTHRIRRVARFDAEIVKAAFAANAPTKVVLNHLDYIDGACNVRDGITDKARGFLAEVERSIGRSVDFVGYDPFDIAERSQVIPVSV